MKQVTLAFTGASGIQYGLRLLQCLLQSNCEVHLLMSDAAREVARLETDYRIPADLGDFADWFEDSFDVSTENLKTFGLQDWLAPAASGGSAPKIMVVCPASGGTLAKIALGTCNNLIERGADVALKERNKLIIVPREAPLSEIHLEHMLKLTKMGAVVMPASPGFYYKPQSVEDLIDFMVARVLDHVGVVHPIVRHWGDD